MISRKPYSKHVVEQIFVLDTLSTDVEDFQQVLLFYRTNRRKIEKFFVFCSDRPIKTNDRRSGLERALHGRTNSNALVAFRERFKSIEKATGQFLRISRSGWKTIRTFGSSYFFRFQRFATSLGLKTFVLQTS